MRKMAHVCVCVCVCVCLCVCLSVCLCTCTYQPLAQSVPVRQHREGKRSGQWAQITSSSIEQCKLVMSIIFIKIKRLGVPVLAQWLMNLTRNHEIAVPSLALLSGLRIQRCCELWFRLQMQLGSRVAVAVA